MHAEQQSQLPRGVAPGPEVDRHRLAGLGSDVGALVADPRIGIERRIVVVLDDEVGAEGAEREPAAGSERPDHALDHDVVLTARRHQPERPLAQADHCVEFAVEDQRPSVEAFEGRTVGCIIPCDLDEPVADVDAVDDDPATCELVSVATRPTPDVEHTVARGQAERLHDVIDLLHRALGERVPQVRLAHVVCQVLEPVIPHTVTLRV